ncbi:MAG: PLP-dependent aspartate aminotransferase family protein [Treponemataceae bacterium]|nr:PLP-dependent aspartate aminotransferase family protein [Treponemataceae bacterium]
MELSLATKCLHLEKNEDDSFSDDITHCSHYGAISFPIYQTSTYAHPAVGKSTGFDYSRMQNPTRLQLEKIVRALEGGKEAVAVSSGMSAISLLMEIFSPSDHIIVDSDLYGGTIRLFDAVSKKNGITFTRANLSSEDAEPLVRPETKAIYLETPTNPMMNVTDIAKMSALAKKHHLLLIVDNTFMSPYFQNPLSLGADVVIHSGTKYLAGHNDVLAGFIVTNDDEIQQKIRYLYKTTGSALSPFDSWLVLRGIKTLAVRMEKSQENALKIAEYLKTQKNVVRVLYPGLREHPGYEIMRKQARGFGAMISFATDTTERALFVLGNVRLIQYAESLGGVESLITYPVTQTHAEVPEEIRLKNGITPNLLRLSVGIENADDLIRDLDQALNA